MRSEMFVGGTNSYCVSMHMAVGAADSYSNDGSHTVRAVQAVVGTMDHSSSNVSNYPTRTCQNTMKQRQKGGTKLVLYAILKKHVCYIVCDTRLGLHCLADV